MTTKVTSSVLADTAVTPGTYGGTQTLPAFIVDAQGRITYAANITSGVITAGTRGQGADIIVPTIQYNALGQIVAATNNTIRTATTSVTGVVQLADSVSNTSTTAAATASAVKAAYDAAGANATTALTSAQANTGAAVITINNAWQSNTGVTSIGLANEITNRQANVGAGLITVTAAYQANVGAGLISAKTTSEANVGAGLISTKTTSEANVGAVAISAKNADNLSSGTVASGRISGSYTGITGVGTLAAGSIPASLITGLYPVGSIYINASVATNPGTLLGFGTWTAFGAGRVMVGFNASNALFDTAEETGGSADAIVVSHTHTATVTDPGHAHGIGGSVAVPTSAAQAYFPGSGATPQSASAVTGISVSNSTEGSSGTNANYQPYITVYMWKRTA